MDHRLAGGHQIANCPPREWYSPRFRRGHDEILDVPRPHVHVNTDHKHRNHLLSANVSSVQELPKSSIITSFPAKTFRICHEDRQTQRTIPIYQGVNHYFVYHCSVDLFRLIAYIGRVEVDSHWYGRGRISIMALVATEDRPSLIVDRSPMLSNASSKRSGPLADSGRADGQPSSNSLSEPGVSAEPVVRAPVRKSWRGLTNKVAAWNGAVPRRSSPGPCNGITLVSPWPRVWGPRVA